MINLILCYFIGIALIAGIFYPLTTPFRVDMANKLKAVKEDAIEPDVFKYFFFFLTHPFTAISVLLVSPLILIARFDRDLVNYICSKMELIELEDDTYSFSAKIPSVEQIREDLERIKKSKE